MKSFKSVDIAGNALNCDNYFMLIENYLKKSGNLTAAEKETLEKHLDVCDVCFDYYIAELRVKSARVDSPEYFNPDFLKKFGISACKNIETIKHSKQRETKIIEFVCPVSTIFIDNTNNAVYAADDNDALNLSILSAKKLEIDDSAADIIELEYYLNDKLNISIHFKNIDDISNIQFFIDDVEKKCDLKNSDFKNGIFNLTFAIDDSALNVEKNQHFIIKADSLKHNKIILKKQLLIKWK